MKAKSFHLGQLLSVIGDHLVTPKGISGVYEIMNFLTGQSLYTHQLLIMRDECKGELLRQHPDLAAVDDSAVTKSNWREWLDEQIAKYGESRLVSPIIGCEQRDPISDLGGPDRA